VLLALALLAVLAAPPLAPPAPQDLLATARERYTAVQTYRVTLRSTHGGSSETIRYFYKKPGLVRMEFMQPHPGAVLAYDPATGQARLRPFGFAQALVLTLSPADDLVKSPTGHRVDQSDIGSLLDRASQLAKRGRTKILGEEQISGRQTLAVSVEGAPGQSEGGTHKFILNLDAAAMLPVKVRAYGLDGKLIEEVLMDDLETGVRLDDGFFRQ
jgi:outer membrane lipoprotein-sorting protein